MFSNTANNLTYLKLVIASLMGNIVNEVSLVGDEKLWKGEVNNWPKHYCLN
jgi:hypothetical protein